MPLSQKVTEKQHQARILSVKWMFLCKTVAITEDITVVGSVAGLFFFSTWFLLFRLQREHSYFFGVCEDFSRVISGQGSGLKIQPVPILFSVSLKYN